MLSWSDLNRILDDHPTDWRHAESDGTVTRNRLSLILRGEAIPPASFFRDVPSPRGHTVSRLDPARLNELLRCGASLVVDGVDEVHEPIRSLADRLERTLLEPVRANIYASWRPAPALERHWDTHDIFIAQVSGRKYWRVDRPVRLHPVAGDRLPHTDPGGEPAWDGVLEEGDLLYLPRGWWHVAAALDGPSLHLTLGVYKRTGLDLIEAVRGELRESEVFRRDLPRLTSAAERAAHLERLREELLVRWDDELLDRFLRESDIAALHRRPVVSLPWGATPDVLPPDREAVVQLTTPRHPIVKPLDDGAFELATAGQSRHLSRGQFAALQALLDGQAWRVTELCVRAAPALDAEGVRALLADLVRDGLVAVVDVDPGTEE